MAYNRQQVCDSYFVESHDSFPAASNQDYAKMLGRRRQEAMGDVLSQQAFEAYVEEHVAHMKQMEDETLADVASIDIQQEIKWFMRPYLIDFLVEAHAAFQLLPETLFLAVNLLDRYCSRRVVYKRHYQLVGCSALLIAAKYGDKKDRVPLIRELKSMCCSLYDEEMFTQMEWHVLNTLGWAVGHPTIDTWLKLALYDSCDDAEVEHMTLYLAEIAMYHKDFVGSKPSVMAGAALALARGILRRPEVMDTHNHLENMTLLQLSQKLDRPSQVLMRKYASPHMSGVSIILENFLQEQEVANRCANPPTPPGVYNPAAALHNKVDLTPDMFPGTPQKPFGTMVNGYMTPPITPEGEYFVNGNDIKGYQPAPRCPVTPTPSNTHPYVQSQVQYQSYHQDMVMN